MNAITINGLTKRFGDTYALDHVDLQFEHGKIYGLLGRNGAGKSTLLKIISNRIFADEGMVAVNGKSAVECDEIQKRIYLMSEKNLYPGSLKIRKVFKWTKEFNEGFDIEEANHLAELFGLPLHKKVSSLSTGYQSIFKLIIALCADVDYVLLDEPVLGLDANHREMFYKILIQSYMEKPRTIIIATHLIEEIANLIEDITIIDDGKVLLHETVEALMQKGYSVSGKTSDVDAYCTDKRVIGEDVLGTLKTAYILGQKDQDNDLVEISPMNLQKLFVELTKKEKEL